MTAKGIAIALLSALPAHAIFKLMVVNDTDQLLTSEIKESQRSIDPEAIEDIGFVTSWSDNPDTSSPFTKVNSIRLLGSGYEANIKFLKPEVMSDQLQVIVDSPYTKSKNTYILEGKLIPIVIITINKDKTITARVKDQGQEIPSLEEQRIPIEQGRLLGRPEATPTDPNMARLLQLQQLQRK
jgi:hypothetical protein